MSELRYEQDGRVVTLTLDRPERKNALSARLVSDLIVAVERAGEDASVGAVVVTGAGGTFCSGGDLSQMGGSAGGAPLRGGFAELNLALWACPKPIVAKVRGYALAGGLATRPADHLAKQRLWKGALGCNLEGLCLGPTLADGRRLLVGVADNGGLGTPNQLVTLRFRERPEPVDASLVGLAAVIAGTGLLALRLTSPSPCSTR